MHFFSFCVLATPLMMDKWSEMGLRIQRKSLLDLSRFWIRFDPDVLLFG